MAAAGNEGPDSEPAYPAAYAGVIAVAAVDQRGRPYGRGNRGSYIYVAAPGVDVWGADARGGEAFWTGTSFAAPFVTAAVARDMSVGRAHDINDGRALIAAGARDLGAPGRDPIYGHGLLQVGAAAPARTSCPRGTDARRRPVAGLTSRPSRRTLAAIAAGTDMDFKALVVDKDADGKTPAAVRRLTPEDLPEGEVTVAVRHSTLNYKDGLCLGRAAGSCGPGPMCPASTSRASVETSVGPSLVGPATR